MTKNKSVPTKETEAAQKAVQLLKNIPKEKLKEIEKQVASQRAAAGGVQWIYLYDPQPDITTFELARILPVFVKGRAMGESDWNALGDALRHFRRRPAPPQAPQQPSRLPPPKTANDTAGAKKT